MYKNIIHQFKIVIVGFNGFKNILITMRTMYVTLELTLKKSGILICHNFCYIS